MMRDRVVQRFKESAVVPLRPKVPTVLIHGTRYVLSNYWPMMEGVEESGEGARVIDTGGKGRFRYLWAYDTDRKTLTMWRYSDGDEKVFDRASGQVHTIVTLEKKGQLNRVTHDELITLEREMGRRQDEALRALKQINEENATEWDRRVKEILRQYFDRTVRPEIDRRLDELQKGAIPLGFRVNDAILQHRSKEDQARAFIVTSALSKFTQQIAYDVVSKEVGFDAYQPPAGDGQVVQWEWHNLIDQTYEQYL